MSHNSSAPMRSFEESLPMALLKAREAAMRYFRPILAEHQLTEQQWRILRALSGTEEPLEVGDLAERTSLLAPSVTRILVNLEGRNLIDRQIVEHDQRRSVISLSTKGTALVHQVAPESEAAYNTIEKQFGTQKLTELISELQHLTDQLANHEG